MRGLLLAIQYISIIALLLESWVVFRKWNGPLHSYLFLSCISTLVNNMGYLMEMQATTEESFISALQLSYMGRVWIPFALFLFTMELCRIKIPDAVKAGLGAIHAATFAMVLTLGKHNLYYTGTYYDDEGVVPQLVHSGGTWHHFYMALIIFYILFGLLQMILAMRREKNQLAKKRYCAIINGFIAEACFYVLYKLNVMQGYDATAVGYTIGAIFMFVAIFRYNLLDTAQLAREYVIDELSEGIIALDVRGRVGFYNKPALRLLPELKANPRAALEKLRCAAENREPLELEGRIFTPTSKKLMQDGTEFGTVYALTDDTEHYRYMDELREQKELADNACRAKTNFLANMSHEIRTPINAILGMDEMILRESGERETLGYASDIQSAGKTLLSIINDILDISKIEEGKMEIMATQYDLSSLVNDLMNMTLSRAEDKGLHFEVRVDENVPHLLCGDEIRIRQCALNILTNAVKYTEKGSVVLEIGYKKLTGASIMLSFSVTDTGIGMKEEDMERLFAPFARIEEKRNRNIEGTGLGMSITKQLLELMGSKLEVQSVYGEGSTFSFAVKQEVVKWDGVGRLSCRLEQGGTNRSSYRELFHAPEARVLIVDDTPVNLTVIKGLLKRTRLKMDTAESGQEALRKAESQMYDVILLDHMMPGMDGIETLRELRKLPGSGSVPCIALTANAVSGAREMYMDAGFSDYLSKPVDGAKLEKMLMRYIPPEKLHEPGTAPVRESAASEKATVLVVDDDELILSLAGSILGNSFRVETCAAGAEAAALAGRLRPELILLDINLGGLSGFDVLRELRASPETGGIPVIFLTGESDESAEIEGFRLGAADFVRKPFAPEALIQRTRRVVDLNRLQRGLQSEVKRQTRRAERLTKEMMLALSQTVDAKDHYTNGHSQRVAAYSAEIARRLGKSAREQEQIYEMGLMHDIGKIGVPEEIINKTSRLTDEEFEKIKRHTVVGSEILRIITEMPELSDGARSHHERFDGTGYPDGLKGKDIPEAARIICLADCYDAMTSTRTYSAPRDQASVRAEIERCSGTQFDPDLARVLVQMIDEDKSYVMNERGADINVWRGSDKLWLLGGSCEEEEPPQIAPAEACEDEAESCDSVTLPDWLYDIEGLDVRSGLSHCGGEETYLDTLGIYSKNALENADEIESFWRSGDLADATVKVHALKSTSRAIGAEELGARAEELEMAGKAGDEQTFGAGIEDLLADFRKLGSALSPLNAVEESGEKLPELPDGKLYEAYDAIREFAVNMDSDGAAFIFNYLDGFSIPEGERERVSSLKHAAADFDWESIETILQQGG